MSRDDPYERLFFTRSQILPGTEVMSAYNSSQGWHVFHERHAFCACRTAFAGWKYRGRTHRLVDGSVAFMEPGEVHCNTDVLKASDFKVLFVEPKAFQAAASELGRHAPHFRVPQTEDRLLFNAVYRLCEAVEEGASPLEQEAQFTACMRLFLGFAERPLRLQTAVGASALSRARDYLLERYSETVTLSELAAVAGVSRFHLVRAFARRYGMAPHAFQIHVRVARAGALLRDGFLPVEAATIVGFADQSHLNRHFKRILRIAPGAYARAVC